MRAANQKPTGRVISKINCGAELDKSHKINNLLLQTASIKASKNMKEINTKNTDSSKGVSPRD